MGEDVEKLKQRWPLQCGRYARPQKAASVVMRQTQRAAAGLQTFSGGVSELCVWLGPVATPDREPSVGESVSLFREPDAGKLPVRFDEREQETEPSQTGLRWRAKAQSNNHWETTVTAPVLDSTRHFTNNPSILPSHFERNASIGRSAINGGAIQIASAVQHRAIHRQIPVLAVEVPENSLFVAVRAKWAH